MKSKVFGQWLDWGQAFTQVVQERSPNFVRCFANDSPGVIPGFCHCDWDWYLGLSPELSSPLLLCLHIYWAFSSLRNRSVFSYLLRLLRERQLFKFMLWSNWLGIWGWIYRPFWRPQWTHCLEHQLSDRRAGPGGSWPKSPVTADGFCKLKLVLTSNFHKATGEEAQGSCPSVLGSEGC